MLTSLCACLLINDSSAGHNNPGQSSLTASGPPIHAINLLLRVQLLLLLSPTPSAGYAEDHGALHVLKEAAEDVEQQPLQPPGPLALSSCIVSHGRTIAAAAAAQEEKGPSRRQEETVQAKELCHAARPRAGRVVGEWILPGGAGQPQRHEHRQRSATGSQVR